jgi:two-component system chemotaxis sensor kinase CheA
LGQSSVKKMYPHRKLVMDSFEMELKIGFLDEAASSLAEVETAFLSLETNPNDTATIDKIFRLAHNLKGSSRAVGFDDMGHFTHQFESLLLKVKNKELAITSDIMTVLLACNDHLNEMIETLKADMNAKVDSSAVLAMIDGIKDGVAPAPQPAAPIVAAAEVPPVEFIPVPDAQAFEDEAEESAQEDLAPENESTDFQAQPAQAAGFNGALFTPANQSSSEQNQTSANSATMQTTNPAIANTTVNTTANTTASAGSAPSAVAEESIRVGLNKLEKLINYIGEMVILQAVLREQTASNPSLLLRKTAHQMDKVVKEIQDISLSLRMVPIKPTFQKMQRIVRDTAKALNKEIQLVTVGEDCELDKTILEKIGDPLVHLIRNSVDHGIEKTEDRLKSGKNPAGKVTLSAVHQSGRLMLTVQDDGAGIDPERLKKKAIEKGIIRPNAVLSEQEAVNLIFAPGFSTKEVVTDVSGRGVGMDVVKTNISALSGEISIETKKGQGSTFKINLPLSLAIIDSMVLSVNGERFAVPLAYVHETVRIDPKDFRDTVGAGKLMLLRGENIPSYYLGSLLGKKVKPESCRIAIVIRAGDQPFVLMVDDIIGQFEIVRKKLGKELTFLKGISGSTILGDGKPALIIEPTDLIKTHRPATGRAA